MRSQVRYSDGSTLALNINGLVAQDDHEQVPHILSHFPQEIFVGNTQLTPLEQLARIRQPPRERRIPGGGCA